MQEDLLLPHGPRLPRPSFAAVPIANSMSEIWEKSGKHADRAETSLTSRGGDWRSTAVMRLLPFQAALMLVIDRGLDSAGAALALTTRALSPFNIR
jgi:hypothetical protein